MRKIFVILSTIGACLFCGPVLAGDWVLCANCSTESQFEQAAINAHGERRGWGTYAVANPNTAVFLWVEVVYTPPGEVIMSLPAAQGVTSVHVTGKPAFDIIDNFGTRSIGVLNPSAITLDLAAPKIQRNGGSVQASSVQPTQGERFQFEALVGISKDQVLIRPQNLDYFSSFEVAYNDYPAMLDQAIRTALTANNPAWINGEIKGATIAGLFTALENFWGKGPGGCVVFDNGDSACFQVNVMVAGMVRLLEGTAKTIDGELISVEGAVPNGGGRDVTVHPNTPDPARTSWTVGSGRGGSYWLICGKSGGKVSSCEVRWVAN